MNTHSNRRYLFTALLLCLLGAPPAGAEGPNAPGATSSENNPEAELKSFKVAAGFEISLFAAEPQVIKPVAMNFDARGRLWIASSETYPQVKPGQVPNDKVFVLEDTDGDGKADKSTVFAEGLLIPTGIAPGDGGCYVANSTEMLFLKDTDGDGKADLRRAALAGFGTEDTHHILHTFRWGLDGRLHMEQSIYIHSQVETPRGIKRLDGGGVWRFRPDTMDLEVFFTGLVNGWGYCWNYWGQTFATDGAGGEGINFVIPGCNFTATPSYTPGAERVLKGLNPGSPKYAGLEVLSGRALPDNVQGDLLTNDFRANRVVRFKLGENGAGYDAKLAPDFITCTDRAFRPVDIKMGPDGAIYIADWYNPIINHGEVDFRDPRRDHLHGRIWRVTAKGRQPVERPKLDGAKVEDVLEALLAPEGYTRQQAKNVLRERGEKEVAPALDRWVKGLDKRPEARAIDFEHAKLEALWACECIDVVRPELLKQVLASSQPYARAAAARVVGHWAGQVENPAGLLAPLVTDDEPHVRMEAVRALATLGTADAVTLAMRALDKPVDPFLDYALYKTAVDLGPAWLPAFKAGKLAGWADAKHLNFALKAVKSPDALKTLVIQLKAGQLHPDARRDVYDLIASIGSADDIGALLEQAARSDKLDDASRAAALRSIERAVRQRKLTPPQTYAQEFRTLISSRNPELAAAAMRTAGALRLDVRVDLEKAAAAPATPQAVRLAAVEALASIGPEAKVAAAFFQKLAAAGQPAPLRAAGVVGLTALDVKDAAGPAGELFASARPEDDVSPVLAAFLKREGGADALAAALSGRKVAPDVAKLALRYVQGIGQDAPALTDLLRKSAGVATGLRALSPEEMRQTMADVAAKGDAARGELVFRSKATGCYQCHAIGGAGGTLAPDVRAVGAASPVDYLIDSILQPNKALKDGYDSILVTTNDGDVIQGIKVREDAKELVLRDNLRDEIVIATSNIKSRRPGGSLMPQGLADGLTRGEFLDLVRFLSELGKPGAYAVPSDGVVRRWRVLDPVPAGLATSTDVAPPAGDDSWWPAYTLVAGILPPDALANSGKGVAFARCQVEVTSPGKVRLLLNSPEGLRLWADDRPVDLPGPEVTLDLPRGVRTLTFRIDPSARGNEGLRAELADAPGSTGHAQAVGGK